MLTCPLCQKDIDPPAGMCPRCRADVALLADHMTDLRTALDRAEEYRKNGELALAVQAYLEVLDVDPTNAVARAVLGPVLLALRAPAVRPGGWVFAVALIATATFSVGVFVGFLLLRQY